MAIGNLLSALAFPAGCRWRALTTASATILWTFSRAPSMGKKSNRRMEQGRKELERRAAEFGLEPKLAKLQGLPEGPEKHALAEEIVAWLFGEDGGIPEPRA